MASDTYSLGITGLRADATPYVPETLTIGDSAIIGNQVSDPGRFGAMGYTMMTGAQFLCKRNDGSQGWYTYDAERSTPSVPVLKAV